MLYNITLGFQSTIELSFPQQINQAINSNTMLQYNIIINWFRKAQFRSHIELNIDPVQLYPY